MSPTQSSNMRHSQESAGGVFVPTPQLPEGTVEVVCSASRRRMDKSKHHCYRLFSHTLKLDPALISEWPKNTDVLCWNCRHQFDTVPVSIPRSTGICNTKSFYEVYGVFCSINCAKKYLLERHTHDQQNLLMQLNEVCVNVFGMDALHVFNAKEAPPYIFLKAFGGHMDIDEYRAKSLNCRTVLIEPPFVSHAMVLEEHSLKHTAAAEKTRSDISEEARATTVIEPLKEGQHKLRGLRRPTHPIPAPKPQDTPPVSKFDAYVQSKKKSTTSLDARPTKRPKKSTKTTSPVDSAKGGLNCFLKATVAETSAADTGVE